MAEEKRQTYKRKKESGTKKVFVPLCHYCMMIVSKYFETIQDYVNIVKACKEYSKILELYKYNPIPFHNEKERELFSNIEEYHFYNEEEEVEETIIQNDNRIVKCVHCGKKKNKLF